MLAILSSANGSYETRHIPLSEKIKLYQTSSEDVEIALKQVLEIA